jgi:hypothetical protein
MKATIGDLSQSSDGISREVELGFSFLEFLYQHYLVVIHRRNNDDPDSRLACLVAARAVICTTDQLVAGTSSYYNGVIWYVTYYE